MKILFQCNTVYQLLVVLALKSEYYYKDDCNIIISDMMNNSKLIVDNLVNQKIFNEVYHQQIKNKKYSKIQKIMFPLLSLNDIGIDKINLIKYDRFIFSNPSFENLLIYKKVKRINKDIKMYFYEDGISTYSLLYRKLYVENTFMNSFRNIVFAPSFKYLKEYKGIYTFCPEYFLWEPKEKIRINKNILFDEKLKKIINITFNYNNDILPNDCKYIFFEEGYFADNKEINDLETIFNICEVVGKDNLYIKLHPRNPINRFEEYNIKVVDNFSIPWEVIVINSYDKIEEIVTITFASSALITPLLLLDIKNKGVCLEPLIKNKEILYPYVFDVFKRIVLDNDNYIYTNDIYRVKKEDL